VRGQEAFPPAGRDLGPETRRFRAGSAADCAEPRRRDHGDTHQICESSYGSDRAHAARARDDEPTAGIDQKHPAAYEFAASARDHRPIDAGMLCHE